MPLHRWLQNLQSVLAPRRGQRAFPRRDSKRVRPNLEVLEDRSVPAFIAPVDYTVGSYPIGMQSGDFNGDGIPDLATANSGRGVSVLLSNGDGTFQPARNTPTTYYPSGQNALAVGDFDRDGKLDLATSANGPGGIGVNVLLGRGDGTFVNTVQPSVGISWSSSIATGDMDGDGKLDLVVTADDFFNGQTNVYSLLGHGDGTFGTTNNPPYGPAEAYSPALADLDGDNQLDLVLGGNFTTYVYLPIYNSSQGPRDLGLVAESLTVADFNADGKPDLAATQNGSVSVLLGNGDGSFQAARSFTAGGGSVTAADVNGDRALDLVLGGGNVLLGNGDGNFGPPIPTAATGSHLVVADFNGDGRPDEALTHTTTVTVLLNDGIWDGSPPPPLPPTLQIGDATVTEGHAGTRAATFTVTLSAPSAQPVTVQYATANGTATAGSDYQAASGTLTIPTGQTTGTITVPVIGDRLPEPNETFFVNLSGATNATIADGQAVGTIADDEPRISITDVPKAEGKKGQTTLFTFTVTLSAAYDQPVTMSFQTVNGTATTSDSDYVAKSGTLTFAPGETTKTITLEVKGDRKREANETFYLDLFGNSLNSLFTKKRGVGTILNDD
ncbi:MAG TPA: FG-GAP-like repeat-containing protein [Gemmataceae bacterium]